MFDARSIFRVVARSVVVLLLVGGLCGDSCTVAVCKEDCDPCVQQCKCSGSCANGLAYDFGTVHRLTAYRLISEQGAQGETGRTLTEIVGLSLDFAHGPVEHSAADYTRFARSVIDVNERLLAPRGTQWIPEPVQMFQTAIVVPFRGAGAQESLEFLFDRRGNLVEIHEAYPAGT